MSEWQPTLREAVKHWEMIERLIKGQNFCGTWVVPKLASGHLAFSKAEEIDEYNFHVRSVRPVRAR